MGPRSARERCAAVGGGRRICSQPVGPSELRMQPRSASLSGAGACDHSPWGLRWNSFLCHETPYWVAREACGQSHCGLRRSSRWGREAPY
eukprot:677336-Pyramimonas_sp.AAC.1